MASFAPGVPAAGCSEREKGPCLAAGPLGCGLSSGEDDAVFLDLDLKDVTFAYLLAGDDDAAQVQRQPTLGIDLGEVAATQEEAFNVVEGFVLGHESEQVLAQGLLVQDTVIF